MTTVSEDGMMGQNGLTAAWMISWLQAATDSINAHAVELGELDRAIGDGDHGENMDRGFAAVRAALTDLDPEMTPSDVLRLTGARLITSVGGASGPLYGTACLRAADAVYGETEIDADTVAAMLEAALGGIEERGHSAPGDKTMVDAWAPAVDAARAAADAGRDVAAVLSAAASGAERGAEATAAMVPHKGRASYLGERAVGHRDPGAVSTALILRAAADVVA
jgi:dihydroxyacetone kinase-like protein